MSPSEDSSDHSLKKTNKVVISSNETLFENGGKETCLDNIVTVSLEMQNLGTLNRAFILVIRLLSTRYARGSRMDVAIWIKSASVKRA